MSNSRHLGLSIVAGRQLKRGPRHPDGAQVSSYFGSHTLGLSEMEDLLPALAYKQLCEMTAAGKQLDEGLANAVAHSVREWAMSLGATHYTHWFHPLTGATAEKHDAFYDHLREIETLDGALLVQQEPDASSFPTGGIRSTFEARGYTAWDPLTSFFVWDTALCIPTVFVSYTGEALDYRAPLLKSMQALGHAATRFAQVFDPAIQSVKPMVGWEQEFFLLDRALYQSRPDLMMSGRTIFGASPARGQQLEDHYFGSIPPRVMHFFKDLERVAYRLGIPLRTRHNEVSPAQYELASMYEEAQVAADHNQILRDIMPRVARDHNLQVLFHEKPFAGLNGSGKHCNWSLMADTGTQLMSPHSGDELFFLASILLTLRGVMRHGNLIRASVASYANDFRMGVHEAPPSIVSVYMGKHLSDILMRLAEQGVIDMDTSAKQLAKEEKKLSLGIEQIADISKHSTDRNRTSPFAFTGNKFELRAVGSDANIANPLTVLNALFAEQATEFVENIQDIGTNTRATRAKVMACLADYAKEVQPIIFNGDGYAKEWKKEAVQRKLPELKSTPEALAVYAKEKAIEHLFSSQGIFTKRELASRQEIRLKNYLRKVEIEVRLMQDIVQTAIIPAAWKHQNVLLENLRLRADMKQPVASSVSLRTTKRIEDLIHAMHDELEALSNAMDKARVASDLQEQANSYARQVIGVHYPLLRQAVDKLESLLDDELWPLTKYHELLFYL